MKRVIFSVVVIFTALAAQGFFAVAKPVKPSIVRVPYGEIDGQKVFEYTLTNSNGMILKVINYGATITDIITPRSQ